MGENNNYKYIRGIHSFLDINGEAVLYSDGILKVYDNGEKYLHGEAIVYFKKDDELCSKGFYRFDEKTKKSYIVGERFYNYIIYYDGGVNFVPINTVQTKYYDMMGEEISEMEWKKFLAKIRLEGCGNEDFSCFSLMLEDYEKK
jgi:hypothetical protein